MGWVYKEKMKRLFINFINFYQRFISPWFVPNCRYFPTCSEYAKEAINKFGVLMGLWMSVKRIARCHPFGGSGFDPVPKKEKNGLN